MHDRAVLGDHIVEHTHFRKDLQQLAQLPSGHENELATGGSQRTQGLDATLVANAVARQRSIEPRGEGDVPHLNSSS
jgi:hypothetical protein